MQGVKGWGRKGLPRPPKSGRTPLADAVRTFTMRMTEQQYQQVTKRAFEHCVTKGSIVREALDELLDAEGL